MFVTHALHMVSFDHQGYGPFYDCCWLQRERHARNNGVSQLTISLSLKAYHRHVSTDLNHVSLTTGGTFSPRFALPNLPES